MKTHAAGGFLGVAATLAAGCAVVGPSSVANGRGAYGEVLTATNHQQILRSVVLDRFGEQLVLMSVTSVTANVNFKASAGAQLGAGPSENYVGNLVPLSVGVAYEENPTISYVPVETPAYSRQILAPLPLEQVLLLIRAASDKRLAMTLLVDRMNGLVNPVGRRDAGESGPRFQRAVDLLVELSRTSAGDTCVLGDGGFGLVINPGRLGSHRADFEELVELLGISESAIANRSGADVLVIPIRFSAVSDGASIALSTRSVYDLVQLAAAGAEVPDEQVAAGMATPGGTNGETIRIRSSKEPPEGALVATKVRGHWYYLDDGDLRSKDSFRLLSTVWSAQMSSAKEGAPGPVLTVGVSH